MGTSFIKVSPASHRNKSTFHLCLQRNGDTERSSREVHVWSLELGQNCGEGRAGGKLQWRDEGLGGPAVGGHTAESDMVYREEKVGKLMRLQGTCWELYPFSERGRCLLEEKKCDTQRGLQFLPPHREKCGLRNTVFHCPDRREHSWVTNPRSHTPMSLPA